MKPGRSAHIHIEIGVMHVVEPPEKWDHVVGPMPPPIGVVQKDKSDDGAHPAGEWDAMEQTERPMLRPNRQDNRGRKQCPPKNCLCRHREDQVTHDAADECEMLSS